jgi:hypothetical protein
MADYMTVTACVDFLRTPKDKGGAGLDDLEVFELLCKFIEDHPALDPEPEFFAHVSSELRDRANELPQQPVKLLPAASRRPNRRKVRAHGS